MRHHLVVLRKPYQTAVLGGRKRIECRLSTMRRLPFEAVAAGDLLWLKEPSQAAVAVAVAGKCVYRELRSEAELEELTRWYANRICAEAGFLADAAEWARFVSLIWIETVMRVRPMAIHKADRRGWVVLDSPPYPDMRARAEVVRRRG